MTWTKRRITMIQWHAGDFTITETADDTDRPYRLDSSGASSQCFSTLDEAKIVAALQNELALFKADNAQLRADLDERRQADAFERQAAQAATAPAA
jgi:hypothetical protein